MSVVDAVDGSSPGTRVPSKWLLLGHPMIRRSQGMQTTATVGLDIAKSVFQVHGIDADGNVVVRRQLKRRYVLMFFQKLPAVPGWHRGLCVVALLVARTSGAPTLYA